MGLFSFFKKKPAEPPPSAPDAPDAPTAVADGSPAPHTSTAPEALPAPTVAASQPVALAPTAVITPPPSTAVTEPAATVVPVHTAEPKPEPERKSWMDKLKAGLRKTGSSIATVFTGTQIDEALYEELESALLMSDAGVAATNHLLADLKRRVKEARATEPAAVKALLIDAITDLLQPLERSLVIGDVTPKVMMIAGVNGAGKTTSIGKLTKHLSDSGASVLLAAADTFRAAAREQLAVWADRNSVEIVTQEGGDPAAVSFDAVNAGKARGKDVVMIDTAGRLPTQLHLMEEVKKIKRTIQKAWIGVSRDTAGPPQGVTAPSGGSGDATAQSVGAGSAPHESLLVIDGNTGQNALNQVKAFDEALQLTGLIITKLDGTAKGGVLAAIALWARERAGLAAGARPVAVYFIGVGEKLDDLETFRAREFAQALIQ